jgi:hypothetical protein
MIEDTMQKSTKNFLLWTIFVGISLISLVTICFVAWMLWEISPNISSFYWDEKYGAAIIVLLISLLLVLIIVGTICGWIHCWKSIFAKISE